MSIIDGKELQQGRSLQEYQLEDEAMALIHKANRMGYTLTITPSPLMPPRMGGYWLKPEVTPSNDNYRGRIKARVDQAQTTGVKFEGDPTQPLFDLTANNEGFHMTTAQAFYVKDGVTVSLYLGDYVESLKAKIRSLEDNLEKARQS